jgi:hypothetical protein
MLRAGFEHATPATKRPQTYALDRAATGIGNGIITQKKKRHLHWHDSLNLQNLSSSPAVTRRQILATHRTRVRGRMLVVRHSVGNTWKGHLLSPGVQVRDSCIKTDVNKCDLKKWTGMNWLRIWSISWFFKHGDKCCGYIQVGTVFSWGSNTASLPWQ